MRIDLTRAAKAVTDVLDSTMLSIVAEREADHDLLQKHVVTCRQRIAALTQFLKDQIAAITTKETSDIDMLQERANADRQSWSDAIDALLQDEEARLKELVEHIAVMHPTKGKSNGQ